MKKIEKEIDIYDYLGKYENSSHEEQLKMLKEFLLLSGEYSLMLNDGKDINDIFKYMSNKTNLKYVDKKGIYYYNSAMEKKLMQREMLPWHKEEVDNHIYALAYAFSKSNQNTEDCRINVIIEKLKEMRRNTRDFLFYEDLIYYIRKVSKLYQKLDKEAEERIEIRQRPKEIEIGNKSYCEISEFDQEICEFLNEISDETGDLFVDENKLSNYPILVGKKLRQYNKYNRN